MGRHRSEKTGQSNDRHDGCGEVVEDKKLGAVRHLEKRQQNADVSGRKHENVLVAVDVVGVDGL